MAHWIINTDGGSRGNPGEAAVGVVVTTSDGSEIYAIGRKIGIGTNNEAEYQAVIDGLAWLAQPATQEIIQTHQISEIVWKLDSKLVVEQLSKRWKIKEPRMARLAAQAWETMAAAPLNTLKMTFNHVPRSENARADELLNQALDA